MPRTRPSLAMRRATARASCSGSSANWYRNAGGRRQADRARRIECERRHGQRAVPGGDDRRRPLPCQRTDDDLRAIRDRALIRRGGAGSARVVHREPRPRVRRTRSRTMPRRSRRAPPRPAAGCLPDSGSSTAIVGVPGRPAAMVRRRRPAPRRQERRAGMSRVLLRASRCTARDAPSASPVARISRQRQQRGSSSQPRSRSLCPADRRGRRRWELHQHGRTAVGRCSFVPRAIGSNAPRCSNVRMPAGPGPLAISAVRAAPARRPRYPRVTGPATCAARPARAADRPARPRARRRSGRAALRCDRPARDHAPCRPGARPRRIRRQASIRARRAGQQRRRPSSGSRDARAARTERRLRGAGRHARALRLQRRPRNPAKMHWPQRQRASAHSSAASERGARSRVRSGTCSMGDPGRRA